jgi:soluble lytic murein transglycosylase
MARDGTPASLAAVPSSTATLGPTATPTLTPTPTLPPEVLWPLARQSSADGDYGAAVPLWEAALQRATPADRPEAGLALARAYLEENRREEALALLDRLAAEMKGGEELASVLALLAVTREVNGDWRGALEAYRRSLALDDAAAVDVQLRIARAHVALNENTQAIEVLRAIAQPDVPAAERAEMLEELAMAERRAQAADDALATYQDILGFAARPEYRALVMFKIGETLREAGRTEEATAQFQTIIREQPTTYAAYLALTALDEAGQADVSDLARADILYAARQYDAAIVALQRHLSTAGKEAQAYYALGLCYQNTEQYQAAFASFDVLIEDFPKHALAPEAWMAKAQAAKDNGGDPSGLYHEMVRLYPKHARAPEALWLAAVYQEREGHWKEAARNYRRLATEYPEDSRIPEARFRLGLAAYAQGDAKTALKTWEALPQAGLDGEGRARRLLWLGLAARQSRNMAQARQYWEQAEKALPEGYYGLRARDLLAGAPLTLPEQPPAVSEAGLTDDEWDDIASWVRSWPSSPAPSPTAGPASPAVVPGGSATPRALSTAAPNPTRSIRAMASPMPQATASAQATMSVPLSSSWVPAQDALARRAVVLERFGWHVDAQEAYRLLRAKVWNDASALLSLARLGVERHEHALAIACADRLLALGQAAGASEPPQALRRLAYPTTYGRLVSAEAQVYGFDPLLFLALMRQESRFDPRALSYAGARGLAQVMPDTGEWIAERVDLTGYRHDLLYRPQVSIRLGAWYLGWLLQENNNDWIAALVGYNAGPGNLQRLTGGNPIGDYDLFQETISIAQTKAYVEHIYQQYRLYQQVYGR